MFDAPCELPPEEHARLGWDDVLPPDAPTLADCAPSGWLALELDTGTAEPVRLSDEMLIEALVGFDRLASWAAARQARLLAELLHRRGRDPVPAAERASVASSFAPDEVAVALRLARGTAVARLGTAERLLRVLPGTHALWEDGRIDTPKARAIHDATLFLPDRLTAAVEARVLPRAPQQSLPQLRAALARAVIAADPEGADYRHREARRDRRVCITPEAEGMASLWALLSAPDAAGAYEWLTRLARGLGPDDPRGIDARRADLLVALLTGQLVADADITTADADPDTGAAPADPPDDATAPADGDANTADIEASGDVAADAGGTGDADRGEPRVSVRPVAPGKPLIQIVMAHSTLIGADEHPAELVGEGPIPAPLAREIAGDAVWRRLVVDPLSGTLLDHGRTTYHPPAGLADHVRARDRYCRFPHCRRRATALGTELDHAVPWAEGGETKAGNLHALCRRHHTLKTHGRWRIDARPDGRLTWITPTGHRHTTSPHDHRMDLPEPPARAAPATDDPDPPPF